MQESKFKENFNFFFVLNLMKLKMDVRIAKLLQVFNIFPSSDLERFEQQGRIGNFENMP